MIAETYARHVNPPFVELLGVLGYGRIFTKAKDVSVWDDRGREYLDLLAGFGAVNLGHNHPRLNQRLKTFLDGDPFNLNHVGPAAPAAALGEKLASLLPKPLEISLFASSGAEGVEAGMKLARAATGRSGYIYCKNGFHGTNLGSLSIMGESRLRAPFEPLLAGCEAVPFGDLAALSRALDKKPAAFVVEPLQAEAGVVVPPAGYLSRARELCRAAGTLLVLDEVQTGLGRTGDLFAFEKEGLVPDVLVLAKSLGGGLAPVSAAVTSRELFDRAYGSQDRFDLQSSTFGGNALACAAALETLSIIADERLVDNAREQGELLRRLLQEGLKGHPLVKEVRGRGLLVGVALGPAEEGWASGLSELVARKAFGQWAALKLLERGFLCQPASQAWNVLRLEPPLTIKAPDVRRAAGAVIETLGEYRGVAAVLKDVALRLGAQALNGGAFR